MDEEEEEETMQPPKKKKHLLEYQLVCVCVCACVRVGMNPTTKRQNDSFIHCFTTGVLNSF